MQRACLRVQRAWRARSSHRLSNTLTTLRQMCTCIVCHDECSTLLRCCNGHSCCVGCSVQISDQRCPVCREPRGKAPDRMLRVLGASSGLMLFCNQCASRHPMDASDAHRAWCPEAKMMCPVPECTAYVTASSLPSHVMSHSSVTKLRLMEDGAYHVMFTLTGIDQPLLLCVGDVIVIVSQAPMNRRTPIQLALDHVGSRSFQLNMTLRAHYPGPKVKSLTGTLSQYTLAGLCSDGWTDKHVCGTIPPVLASREATAPRANLVLRPLSFLTTDAPIVSTILENSRPCANGLQATFYHKGVRDLPEQDDAQNCGSNTEVTKVSIVHLSLFIREDAPCIGDVFRT